MSATDLKPKTPAAPPFLTIIPSREPREKVHLNIGHAKNAVSQKVHYTRGAWTDMAIFRQNDGEWQLLYAIDEGTQYEGVPWVKEA